MVSRAFMLTVGLAFLFVLVPSHAAKADILSDINAVFVDVGKFFTTTMPNFFTKDLPTFFSNLDENLLSLGTSIEEFFSDAIPRLIQLSSDLTTFFAEVIPQLGSLTEALANFFTDIIPRLAEFGSQLVGFFGELIPKLAEFGAELAGFFTTMLGNIDQFASTIVSFFETLSEGISAFGENIFAYFESFSETVSDLTSNMDDHFEQAFDTIKDFQGDFLVGQFEDLTDMSNEFFNGGFQETFTDLTDSSITSPLEAVFGDVEERFSSLDLVGSLSDVSGALSDVTSVLADGDLSTLATEFPQFTKSIQGNLDALDELVATMQQFLQTSDGTNLQSLQQPIEDALVALQTLVEILPQIADVFAGVEGDAGAESFLQDAVERSPEILQKLPDMFHFFTTEFPIVIAEAEKQFVTNIPTIVQGLPQLVDSKIAGILTTLSEDITVLLQFIPGTDVITTISSMGDTSVSNHLTTDSMLHQEQSRQLIEAVNALLEKQAVEQVAADQVSIALLERQQLERQLASVRAEIQALGQRDFQEQLALARAENQTIRTELERIMQLLGVTNTPAKSHEAAFERSMQSQGPEERGQ